MKTISLNPTPNSNEALVLELMRAVQHTTMHAEIEDINRRDIAVDALLTRLEKPHDHLENRV